MQPSYRGRGVGFGLLRRIAQIAVDRGAHRLDWAVLDWNEPAIAFYRRLGAEPMSDWMTMRLSGNALCELGQERTMKHEYRLIGWTADARWRLQVQQPLPYRAGDS